MRSGWIIGSIAALALAVASIPRWMPGLGVPAWHHTASLVVTLALYGVVAQWTRADARRHHAIAVGAWTVAAIVTGFLILYLKPALKDSGYKDWAKLWHVAWSWMALWYAIGHVWIDRAGLVRALRRWHASARAMALYDGLLLSILLLIPVTWSAWGARIWVDANYIPWTLWTALVMVGGAYAVWAYAVRRRSRGGVPPALQAAPVRSFTDVWLVPMALLANLSGIPIVYFGTKDTALKFVAKYWHTWPSIAMAILVFAHTIQFWPALRRHWQRT